MSNLSLLPGHNIFIVRFHADARTTREEAEALVIDWLAAVLDADASRRSAEGEYVVGPANPATVIPMLDLDSRELADRETRLCEGGNQALLGDLPTGTNGGALVHVDWSGVASEVPSRWTHHFGSGLLADWSPTEQGETPDLAVTAECHQSERARPPIAPPPLFELPERPELPTIPAGLGNPLLWIGVGAVAVVGWHLWHSKRRP